ncbi:T9SS type A sorting domain-containing protein [Riemerella anatipestifer]|uniref:T9SS type A sorting domain-containing protein n=1 Tax=Riemerella anatipestifer TaxID=34085 RepID=UPI0007EC5A11|nr:T9SS type A sorting domain-containing protein [Riemerella anatipestifer]MCU7581436.1 T9SS type A sorting domain-containing protein [Riemerella anatipestifer]OBP51399.1 hypothetical protein AWM66_09280 [Riemerella anatipestifer]WNC04366.1 T9SS type A sorting domain-containing protein [Riemerella anatipestifer]
MKISNIFATCLYLLTAIFSYGQIPSSSKFEIIPVNDSTFHFKSTYDNNDTYYWEFNDGVKTIVSIEKNPIVHFSSFNKIISKLTTESAFGRETSKREIYKLKEQYFNLSTGIDKNGSPLNDSGELDNNWNYVSSNGEKSTPYTRYAMSGWSSPITNNKSGVSNWITAGRTTTGYHYYHSRVFSVPNNTNAVLNLRSLSFVRGWTYLVKINDDNSEIENEITKTSWLSDGAKGWLNSRNPEVENYLIPSGKYYIKVKAYTNNSSQRQAINVNTSIRYEKNIYISDLETVESTVSKDYKLAPNSYIFDVDSENDGLYIPVKKAYEIWASASIPTGINQPINDTNKKLSAFVYWEDISGLIKSNIDYRLNLIGNSQSSVIEVPINKTVGKGNAVISFHIGENGNSTDPIYWSWHVWVTDNPYNGSKHRQGFEARQLEDGSTEIIPDEDWGWMDRNLGSTNNSFGKGLWKKSEGLLYQWGRKDPIPPLVTNMDDFYEIEGIIGKVRHPNAKYQNGAKIINDFTINSSSPQKFKNQLIKSIQNPLSLLYINLNYNNNPNLPYNWFGDTDNPNFPNYRLARLNLWSDNSKGISNEIDANADSSIKPYQTKSYFDPCPNGWRMPSVLVSHTTSDGWGTKDLGIRLDYSPFGFKTNITTKTFEMLKHHIIKPTNENVPSYMKGIKVYNKIGFDLTDVNEKNMGIFPGTGFIAKNKSYTDTHETYLWTATMMSWYYSNKTPHVEARSLRLVPDGDQKYIVDPRFPNVHGLFYYFPLSKNSTSDALACRCIKDPLYNINNYNFPTIYFKSTNNKIIYKEGLNNPNTYNVTKSNNEQVIEIPVSKAFSVYNQILSDNEILELGDLKANVFWTTNKDLIQNISINTPNSNLENLKNTKIVVKISPNQSGNALISLHNRSIKNPIYWSWHIWVSDTDIKPLPPYTTEPIDSTITNYVNYAQNNLSITTEFMDRNLGALNSFPTLQNPNNISEQEIYNISTSGGLLYQYGRKDPLPSFETPDGKNYHIYTSSHDNVSDKNTYIKIDKDSYSRDYTIEYNTYSKSILSTDKKYQKLRKNIIFSIRNPLSYMIPSNYNNLYILGTDWVSDEPNEAHNRWGHSGDKSVFDPCPYGWKIPNIISGSSDVAFQKGTTPWYKKGISEADYKTPINSYNGNTIKLNNKIIGYTFPSDYSIGNYSFIGIKGFRGNSIPISQNPSQHYSGVWSSGFSSHYKGFANGILFDNILNSMQIKRDFDPYMALNVRCVKYEKEPLIFNISFPHVINNQQSKLIDNKNNITIHPNPTQDVVFISIQQFEYKIINTSGAVIKHGYENSSKVDFSNLPSGAYILHIKNGIEKSFKIIKK